MRKTTCTIGAFISFFLVALSASTALAQSDEEKFEVGSRFLESLLSPYYLVYFANACEMYTMDDAIGEEALILFEHVSPQESNFDAAAMELNIKSEVVGGIIVSTLPDYIEREVDEVYFFADEEELGDLTAAELDSIDVYLKRVLEFFRDSCRT